MGNEINISLDKIFTAGSAVFTVFMFVFFSTPYTGVFVFTILLLAWGSYYALISRKHLSEMCCMMSGMVFGMIAGFFVGTVTGLATGDFLVGMIAGTIAGVLFGIPTGKMGGPLGRMEAVMAGPMGGIMGGMTGIMIRFFNVELFMPFFMIVVLFTVWEMTNVIRNHSNNISRGFLAVGVVLSLLAFSSAMTTNVNANPTEFAFGAGPEKAAALSGSVPVNNGGVQEITIKAGSLTYEPNYIVVKKDVPVKINLEAAPDAGCTRSFVFPDFGITKTIPKGGRDAVQFTPQKTGTFKFSCGMGMARGTLIVQ